jgi:hypothetical protein
MVSSVSDGKGTANREKKQIKTCFFLIFRGAAYLKEVFFFLKVRLFLLSAKQNIEKK